jgi:hypothetical protein
MKKSLLTAAVLVCTAANAQTLTQDGSSESMDLGQERMEAQSSRQYGFEPSFIQNLTGTINVMKIKEPVSQDFDADFADIEKASGYSSLGLKFRHESSKLIFTHGLELGLTKNLNNSSAANIQGGVTSVNKQEYSQLGIRLIDMAYKIPVSSLVSINPTSGAGITYSMNSIEIYDEDYRGVNTIKSHKGVLDLRAGAQASVEATQNIKPFLGAMVQAPIKIRQGIEQKGDWHFVEQDEKLSKYLDAFSGPSLALELGVGAVF